MSYEKTSLPGGIPKLIQVCEHLRANNQDGYIQHQGSLIARIKGDAHRFGKLITCSPFTGSAIGVAFDPKFPRGVGEAYEPMFNGGKDLLPFAKFYAMHNDHDQPAQSLPAFGLGELIDMKKMRRGDQVGIDWFPTGGHSVFVWDVHLDEHGDVDCFQMIGAHGPAGAAGYGIFIYGCHGKKYLKGNLATGGPGTGSLEKAKDPLFVDSDDVVSEGVWFGLPGVTKIDARTFRATPKYIQLARQAKHVFSSIKEIKVARFNYDHKLPDPYCMKEGGAAAYDPGPPGHVDAPVTTIKGNDLKKDPAAPAKVKPKPAAQDKSKPLQWQHQVESGLQEFFRANWIDKDPGNSDNLNDAASQAAIKAFQAKFKLDVDGIVGPITWGAIGKQLPACRHQQTSEVILIKLFRGGKLKTNPGKADGVNDDQTKKAVLEFQKANGLTQTGLPDADTFAKLQKADQETAVSSTQHGLEPQILLVYWLGNGSPPGGSATLRVHTKDVKRGQVFDVVFHDFLTGKESDAGVKLQIAGDQTDLAIPIPADFPLGSWIAVLVKAVIDGGKTLQMLSPAPLQIRNDIQPAQAGGLEKFFTYDGEVGESKKARKYQYLAYKVPGKGFAWFMKGRYMVDIDGAPNCYHLTRTDVLPIAKYATDMDTWPGPLDKLSNGGHPGNWFGMLTDESGNPVKQKDTDPCPTFCISTTSLVDRSKKRDDPTRYADARKIPYIAFPKQIWLEGKGGTLFTRVGQGPTGNVGDFATVVNIAHPEYFGHAVIADIGDKPHFGEGSPAIGKKLHFLQGTYEPELLYIVYPRSGAGQGTIPSADQIESKGGELFKKLGGADEVRRVLGLMK